MALKLMYITNKPEIAQIAEENSVDRIFVDLETIGKAYRQKGLDSVKSMHTFEDISVIRNVLKNSELLVRVNPIHAGSEKEINEVICRGADIIMLPMIQSMDEVEQFIAYVNGRCKKMLLIETVFSEQNINVLAALDEIDEYHIGINDLHLEHKKRFMFEMLSEGNVENICLAVKKHSKPYGFGGIANLNEGMLPARNIIAEHYRLGSTAAILSRSFCDTTVSKMKLSEVEEKFKYGIKEIRDYEKWISTAPESFFADSQYIVKEKVEQIVEKIVRKDRATLNYETLERISKSFGESFYLLDSEQFRKNFLELQDAFRNIYPETYIAYSYKTNYIPKLCKIVDELGGYAEVVSDMEIDIANRIGVLPENIIFNGPYKNKDAVQKLLLAGGCVNIDSISELEQLREIAKANPDKKLNLGIRCNFSVNDNVLSRFGVDIDSDDFKEIIDFICNTENVYFKELHCHFATRSLDTWKSRVTNMVDIIDKQLDMLPENIDFGGGIFGKMPDSLKNQFGTYIPSYTEYANVVATAMAKKFAKEKNRPKLFIEPGSALAGDCMKFVAKVLGIKQIRGKSIATVLGSVYNINPTLNKKNPPIEVYNNGSGTLYQDLDFGGFTCIESDYLYRHYNGILEKGDYVVFGNAGSYSVVLKPPFILPNFAVIDIQSDEKIEVVKRKENFEDLFQTFAF